jgi:hypothetical protein
MLDTPTPPPSSFGPNDLAMPTFNDAMLPLDQYGILQMECLTSLHGVVT